MKRMHAHELRRSLGLLVVPVLIVLGGCAEKSGTTNGSGETGINAVPENSSLTAPDQECMGDYELGRYHFRVEIGPRAGDPMRYTLRCGPASGGRAANDIVVTQDSNLRIVNTFDKELRVAVDQAGRYVFGLESAAVVVPVGGMVDLRVQSQAETDDYVLSVATRDAPDQRWQDLQFGDSDPRVKVKGHP